MVMSLITYVKIIKRTGTRIIILIHYTERGAFIMSFIEELYYGNINPYEIRCTPSKKYDEASKLILRFENKLKNALNEPELTALNRMIEAQSEADEEMQLAKFKLGFKLGVQTIIDCLSPNDDSIKND